MKNNQCKRAFLNKYAGISLILGIVLLIAMIVVTLSLGACDTNAGNDDLQSKYDKAVSLIDSERYEEAITILESLEGYGDSSEQIKACREAIKEKKYNQAIELMETGNYKDAVVIFKELDGYKFSNTHITNCQSEINEGELQLAVGYIDRYEYATAAEILEKLGNYKNASKLLEECRYYLDYVFSLNISRDGYVISEYKGNATEVILPEKYAGLPVVRIGSSAFERATSIVEITVPACIIEIGSYAFSECVSLERVLLPRTLRSIGEYAFTDCGALSSITFAGSEDEWGRITKGEGCYDAELLTFAPKCDSEHHYAVIDEAVLPTCEIEGLTEGAHCYLCGVTISAQEKIEALGHDEITHAAQEPTCEEIGWNAYVTCLRCDYSTYEEKSALGHDKITHAAQEPTCEEIGWNAYVTCLRCDYSTYEEKSALGHDEITHTAQDPTCTEIGWDAYVTCSRCDYTTYEEKSALGHDEITHAAQEPTCEEIGWNAYVTCSRCDYTTYVEVAALDHDITEHASQDPTCLKVGWDAYVTCSRCDYTTYEERSALDHSVVKCEAKTATCTEIGWDEYEKCTRCDYTTYVEISVLPHDTVEYDAFDPTCTEIGWNAYVKCKNCEYSTYSELPKDENNHDLVFHNEKAPTCTEIGWNAYVKCKNCEYSTYSELPKDKNNHDLVFHNEKAPTCTEIGWNAFETCSRCDYTTYSELEKDEDNHNIIQYSAQAPTCTSVGWEAYEACSRCIYSTYIEIEKTEHQTVKHDARAPSCTEVGWSEYETCENCKYTTYSEIPALNHDLTAKDGKKPTCAESGWKAYEICLRCGHTTYEEIPATGKHTYDNERTCTVCLDYADKGVVFTLEGESYGVTDYTGSEKRVVIPSKYNGIPVTYVGKEAFSDCASLECVVLTENLSLIGDDVFKGCTSLETVNYTGTEEAWFLVAGTDALTINAEIVFEYNYSDVNKISIHMIDVGQGDAILIMTPWGNMLIDSGDLGSTPREALTSYLAKYNVTSFEYVIFTHPDADHIGSGDYVIENYDVKTVIMPDCERTTQVYQRLISAIENSSTDVILIGTESDCENVGYTFNLGQVSFKVMGPTQKFNKDDSNNFSVVVRMDHGETSALFTGDAEDKSENAMLSMYKNGELDCDILKVGHHGSTTSTTADFLAAVSPEIAIISCGEGNKYGHPHNETVEKLSGANVETYRTDKNGDIVITTDGIDITVSTETQND